MIQIIATNITNLTDARYFAARGATYLFYRVSGLDDIPKIQAIQGWIDGPLLGLELGPNLDAHEQNFVKEKLRPEALLTRAYRSDICGEITYFLKESVSSIRCLENLSEVPANCLLLKQEWTTTEILQIQSLNLKGLILQGSNESEIGLKDYDTIDEILDEIERINSTEAKT